MQAIQVPPPPRQDPGSWNEAVIMARKEAALKGWHLPPRWVHKDPDSPFYRVGFHSIEPDDVDTGERREILVGVSNGISVVSNQMPMVHAGDRFIALQYPIHTGRLGGVFGRALVCFTGIATALVSAMGLWMLLTRWRLRAVPARRGYRSFAAAARAATDRGSGW